MGPRGPHEKKGTSLDDGTFVLEDLAETTYHVWAEYGRWPQARSLGVAAGSTFVQLQFREGASVAGVVLDAAGKPATSGSVFAYLAEAGGESWERSAGRLTMVSVAKAAVRGDGAFELTGLSAEAYDLCAKTADGRSGTLSGVQVRDGESKAGLRLVLESSVTAKGLVVEHGSRRPLGGAKIIAFLPGGEVVSHADAAGVFRIMGVVREHPLRFIVFSPDANHIDDNRIVHVAANATGEVDLGSVQLLEGTAGSRDQIRNLGWRLENIDGRTMVASTRPGDAVASAGILPGAVLLEVDGRDVTSIGSSAAGFLICGPVGSVVRLKVQQPTGGVRTVEFVRKRREG
jgi:hypothetical protein